jgi:curved DNA-binding protein CbpA
MDIREAYQTLELEPGASEVWIKIQYRWLVKLYHPDNKETAHRPSFERIVQAYKIINEYKIK